jgi:NADPH:quinone reductase-like Zn-dependent oxidoreductase
MKAVVMREFGPPNVLRLEDVPVPEPGPGEVLIEVHAVSVNRTLDLLVRAGTYAHAHSLTLPHVLGVDPSGIIVAVGPGVTNRKVGDRVATTVQVGRTPAGLPILLGVHVWGGYAEYVKVPADITHLIPDGLDFPTATIVTRHAAMAFHLLRDRIKVQPGEWVLVMGAAGGLGSAGVQVAKELGAKVIAAAGADERVKVALELGADAGVNYRTQDLTAEVMRITGRRGVDVVFENIADPELFPKALASITSGGRMITAGSHGGGIVPLDVSRLYLYQITIMGAIGEGRPDVARALEAAAKGRFKVLIDRILPLSEAARAHEIVAARSGVGKVVLDPRA